MEDDIKKEAWKSFYELRKGTMAGEPVNQSVWFQVRLDFIEVYLKALEQQQEPDNA